MDSSSEDDEPIFVDLTRPSVIIIDFRDDDNSPNFQPTTTEMDSNGQILRQYRGAANVSRQIAEQNLRRLQEAQQTASQNRSNYVRTNVFRDVASRVSNAANVQGAERRPRRRRRVAMTDDNKENALPMAGEGLAKNVAYCVKCKQMREMVDAKEIKTKNNRKAMSGECKICGTRMMKFIK